MLKSLANGILNALYRLFGVTLNKAIADSKVRDSGGISSCSGVISSGGGQVAISERLESLRLNLTPA